jgi:hypothetical protein
MQVSKRVVSTQVARETWSAGGRSAEEHSHQVSDILQQSVTHELSRNL